MYSPTNRAGFLPGVCLAAAIFMSAGAHAEDLPLGVPTSGALAQSANADYTLTLPAPGRLTVVLDGWLSTYNWGMDIDRLYLYNSAGNPVGWESLGREDDPYVAHMMETNDSDSIDVGQAGVYTLRLHSGENYNWEDAVSQSYTITVTLDEANDTHEDNGSIETATEITPGNPMTAYQWRPVPAMSVYDDEDFYRVDLPSPGILTISLEGWVSTYNWGVNYDRMYIYTDEGVAFDDSGTEDIFDWMMGDPGLTTVNLAAGGEYVINLHAGNGTNVEPYTIQCDFQPVDDTNEPNNDVGTATPLTSGVELSAYQWRSLAQGPQIRGDEDWYSFTMGDAGTASLAVTGWVSTYNWGVDYDRLYLYEAGATQDGEEIMSQHMIGEAFTHDFELEAGEYVFRLHSGNGTSAEPYTLRLECPETPVAVTECAPESFQLEQPYPNPFNPETTLTFTLPEQARVSISIYDITGQRVRTIVDSMYSTGVHSEVWNGSNDSGAALAAGVYFVRLNAGNYSAVRRVVMIK